MRESKVMLTDSYRGINFAIVARDPGYLTGYINVSSKVDYTDELFIHGGITYDDKGVPGTDISDGRWIGFDCAHYGDAMRPELYGLECKYNNLNSESEHEWTVSDVKSELIAAIKQILLVEELKLKKLKTA